MASRKKGRASTTKTKSIGTRSAKRSTTKTATAKGSATKRQGKKSSPTKPSAAASRAAAREKREAHWAQVQAERLARNKAAGPKTALGRLRKICLGFPDATEVPAWGEPTFRVKNKVFAIHATGDSHHANGRPSVWIYSVSMEQDLVMRARPDRYFKPPYVGASGWIGAWIDKNPPWGEIEVLLRDGYERRKAK